MRIRRPNAGFSLIELMTVVVIMSILSVGLSQFSAFTTGQQAAQVRQSANTTNNRAALSILENDITMAGYGGLAGFQTVQAPASATANTDTLQLWGATLTGSGANQWGYVLQAVPGGGASKSLQVSCNGTVPGGAGFPDPLTDITLVGTTPKSFTILNYAGQAVASPMPADAVISATSNSCTPTGPDMNGDGKPDMTETITITSAGKSDRSHVVL